jgi:GNAT superfamily N-acetyltransferase
VPVNLAVVTHAEHPELRGTLPRLWPEFMSHDPVVETFWPRLYEVYPDFQMWLVDTDAKETIGYACTLPVRWDGVPQPRGVDWAMSNGAAGEPTTLCAIVAGVVPAHRSRGLGGVILGRMVGLAAAHGFDCVIAPVRPSRKERYPLIPIERYVRWRREDGYMYDPWLRTHERLGAELLELAPRSLTISGSREEWEAWTDLQYPEDGDYIVPGALVPVHFQDGRGTYAEPNVWMRHPIVAE